MPPTTFYGNQKQPLKKKTFWPGGKKSGNVLGHNKKMALHSLKLTAKAPENKPSQKKTGIPTIHFQVLC